MRGHGFLASISVSRRALAATGRSPLSDLENLAVRQGSYLSHPPGEPLFYSAVLERVDREQPLSSPLLTKLRGEAKSNGIRQSHGGLSREQAQTLRNWIEAISEKPEPVVPVKAESVAQEDEAKSDSPKPRADAASSDDADDNLYRRLVRELRSSDPN